MGSNRRLRRDRIIIATAAVLLIATVAVLAVLHGREVLAFFADGQRVQEQAKRLGPLAPVALGVLVVLQEVTVIVPSEPLELAAGYAFGFWEGALVYLSASIVGCLAVIGIVHVAGDRVLRALVPAKRRTQLQRLRDSRRFDMAILVAFFIPGLPKDLMAYGAALAGMNPVHLVAVTTAGRLPSVLAATLASSYAAQGDWRATAIVFVVAVAGVLAATLVYHRLKRRRSASRRQR